MNAQTAPRPAALGARMGFYAGLASLVFLIVLYFIRPTLVISPAILFLFLFVVAFKVAAAYDFWKARQGAVDFKDALQAIFLVSVVSLLMVTAFFYIMLNSIDPSLTEKMRNNIAAISKKAFDEGKITQEEFEQAQEKAWSFRLGAVAFFMAYSVTLFIGFFYALVFAGISQLIGRNISIQPPSNS